MNDGVKKVTPENWLKQDGANAAWVAVDLRDGSSRTVAGEDWIKQVNAIGLAEVVDPEIVALFNFAKGALGYGYFYYPLFTLVAQQLLRVADIAVDRLFGALALSPKPISLHRRLLMLKHHGLIDEAAFAKLDLMRRLRNNATHSSFRTIIMPTDAIREMRFIATLISELPWPRSTSKTS